eukprot:PITA_23705
MEDRLSALPNEIVGLILSKIWIKEAIRCSVLSKRWRDAYTHISEFELSPVLLMGPLNFPSAIRTAEYRRQCVENTISNILQAHSSYVESFSLSMDGELLDFTRENVCRWVQYAASKNVQRIALRQTLYIGIPPPAPLFTCARLTTLKLSNYALTDFPDTFLGFNYLISCCFCEVKISEDSLSLFISRCPLLQKLTISRCAGKLKPVISAPNITDLVLDIYNMETLTVNCPKLMSVKAVTNASKPFTLTIINSPKLITLETKHSLLTARVFFHDLSLSRAVRFLTIEGLSWLVELNMLFNFNFSAAKLLEMVSTFKKLKKLGLDICDHLLEREDEDEEMTVPLYKMFERLPALEFLFIGRLFLSKLARNPIPQCLSCPLANLRILQVDTLEFDDGEIAVLGCLLQSSPALEIMEFRRPNPVIETPEYTGFKERLFSLRRASTQVRFSEGFTGDTLLF